MYVNSKKIDLWNSKLKFHLQAPRLSVFISLCLSPCLYLFISVSSSICLFVCLSPPFPSLSLFISLSFSLSPSLYLYLSLSLDPSYIHGRDYYPVLKRNGEVWIKGRPCLFKHQWRTVACAWRSKFHFPMLLTVKASAHMSSVERVYGLRRNHQTITLRWRHNGRNGVSNHHPPDCLLIKVPRHWPLCVEFTGNRWIPCSNGQ